MRIAILADIHGNLPALAAVSAELERLQPDEVVLNGDIINGAPFSSAVIDVVRQSNWVTVRGNHEFYYLDFGTERAASGSEDPRRWGQLHWLADQITPQQGVFLAVLPDERTFFLPGTQPLSVTHGVPGNNRMGFTNQTEEAQVAAALAGIAVHTVVSAHTHVQIDRQIHRQPAAEEALIPPAPNHSEVNRWHLINPGSVGMPLNGDPRAQFAIIESVADTVQPGGWQVSFHRVNYDRRPVLTAFSESGMAAAGGAMTELFYWQIVTARPEVVFFFRWAYEAGLDPNNAIDDVFRAYLAATGRGQLVHHQDPLYHPSA